MLHNRASPQLIGSHIPHSDSILSTAEMLGLHTALSISLRWVRRKLLLVSMGDFLSLGSSATKLSRAGGQYGEEEPRSEGCRARSCHSYQRGTSSNYLAIAGFQHLPMEGRARDPVDCAFEERFDFVDPDLLRIRKMRVIAESN